VRCVFEVEWGGITQVGTALVFEALVRHLGVLEGFIVVWGELRLGWDIEQVWL